MYRILTSLVWAAVSAAAVRGAGVASADLLGSLRFGVISITVMYSHLGLIFRDRLYAVAGAAVAA